MSTQLDGKNILVTGSSRGIGAGIAMKLAEAGANVAVTYSASKDKAEKVFSELKGEGHLLVQLNINDSNSVEQAFKTINTELGPLDGLVNNAGVTKDQLLLRMKEEDFSQVIDTNLKGAFLCTKLAIKPMMKKRQGSIVNITSVVGQTGNAGQANYAASKAGLEAFGKSVAQELGGRGIRVNCVAPGFIVTDMTETLTDDQKQNILGKVPLGTLGDINDVAHAVTYLLSDEAKYITGQTLGVNGGMYM